MKLRYIACLIGAAIILATPDSAVGAPKPTPSDRVSAQGVYSLTSHYAGDRSAVRAWSITWEVPQITNGAWGAVGQWFSNLEAGIYHSDRGWWVYYYGDDNGTAENNPECVAVWDSGERCFDMSPGQRVTFTYEYCNNTKQFSATGSQICLWANMHDGYGDRFLARDLPRAEGPEMYAHDVETFKDSGFLEPEISCAKPTKMMGQRARIGNGKWTTLGSSSFQFVDRANYHYQRVTKSSWQSCSDVLR